MYVCIRVYRMRVGVCVCEFVHVCVYECVCAVYVSSLRDRESVIEVSKDAERTESMRERMHAK
jgi:hypothetical protein